MDKNLALSLRLIQQLFHLNYISTEDRALQEFSARTLFHPAQFLFTYDALKLLSANLSEDTIYHFSDAFDIRIALFSIDGEGFIIGPYTELHHSPMDAVRLLRHMNLSNVQTSAYLQYRGAFPNIRTQRINEILLSLFQVHFPERPAPKIRELLVYHAEAEEYPDTLPQRPNMLSLLSKRYEAEQKFIAAVKHGNIRASLDALQIMEQDVAYLKRIGRTLESERIGAAITRTTLRLASMQAGLSPYIIDQLSSENTAFTQACQNVEEIISRKKTMVRSFCMAIRKHQTENHSALSQSIRYFLEHNLHKKISLETLAEELGVSENYLIRIFRQDYHSTPVQYLLHLRMERAKFLLTSTRNSVQTIGQEVGIPDSTYFIKLFKRHVGMTPNEYRKQKML